MFFPCYRQVLHKYANEDVSLGSWFIGLDVEHIDDRSLCCGTPPGKFEFLKDEVPFFDVLHCFLFKFHILIVASYILLDIVKRQ